MLFNYHISENMKEERVSLRNALKFIASSVVGIMTFILPINYLGDTTNLISLVVKEIERILTPVMDGIVIVIISISTICSIYYTVQSRRAKQFSNKFRLYFGTTIMYTFIKIVALVFVILCTFNIGPEKILNSAQSMVNFGSILTSLAFGISFILVFLTDSGLMEFTGVLFEPFMEPLFKIPSVAAIDCITSWIGSSDAAVMLTKKKYESGVYSKREAAVIMCNFSLVSLPFCMVVAELVGIGSHFTLMYGLLCILGILLAIITPRIYPLNRIKDEYFIEEPPMKGKEHYNGNILKRAFLNGCEVANNFSFKKIAKIGFDTMSSVLFGIMPIAIGLGVIGIFIVDFTPVFHWISLPMEWLLRFLGVESASEVAPATLVGFIDQYIPPLLVVHIESVGTRFIIATLSLIQIIYLTIVGAVALQSNIELNIPRLFLIFMERTLISLPIIVLVSKLFFR